jgi:hypothetical protein
MEATNIKFLRELHLGEKRQFGCHADVIPHSDYIRNSKSTI